MNTLGRLAFPFIYKTASATQDAYGTGATRNVCTIEQSSVENAAQNN
jgi:hypothetical protein